jgi:hypothetical protein
MIRRLLISLGIAFLADMIAYMAIFVIAPGMYVEKAFNILVAVFVASVGITSLALTLRGRR